MNPKIFGKEHLIYIALSLLTAFIIFFLAKRFAKKEKTRTIFLKSMNVILLLIILANRLVLVFEYDNVNWVKILPDSFCSASSYVLSLAILFGKKNNNVLHFIWLVALAGGAITTFYPIFIDQHPSFMYPPTILGIMHHTISAIVVILMLMFGYCRLTYKKWYCTFFGFMTYLAYGSFLMCVLEVNNPFYMTGPAISGTIFNVWIIAPIYMVVYGLILLILEFVRNGKTKSVNN